MNDLDQIKQLYVNELEQREQNIVKAGVAAAEAKVIVGYELKQIRDKKLYRVRDYSNMDEYAQAVFGMNHTAASRAMSFNDKYSVGGNSTELDERFKGYKPSLLQEMLSLPAEDYDLIDTNTRVEDVRELAKAEKEQQKEEERTAEQIQGQESLLTLAPDVVPESEKPKKEETTITEVLRELFRPREMKERLDSLVNMDPDSSEMRWWVGDFNQQGNRVEKIRGYFIFFYGLDEGLQIRNVPKQESNKYTYKDFYFMVRAAFGQETVRGTDVWFQAFGAEYEAEQQRIREAEARQREEEKRKKDLRKEKDKKQRAIKENQGKSAVEDSKTEVSEQKEDKNAAALKEINENSASDNNLKCSECEYYYKDADAPEDSVDCHYKPNKENGWNEIPPCERKGNLETETPEIVTGTVEQEEKNSMCDIAQIPESAFMTSLERAKWVKGHSSSGEHHAVTVDADTYQDIITGWKRFIVLEYKATDGDILTIYNGENKPIEAIVIDYEYIPEGNGVHIAGFEVLDYGQEE